MAVYHYQGEAEVGSRPKSFRPNTFPLLYIFVLVILLYSIFLVARSVIDGAGQAQILRQRQAALDEMKLKLEVQERFVAYQKTPSYIEKQAREHFGYAKEGETVVAVPQNTEGSSDLANEQAGRELQAGERVNLTRLQQWWDYFFGQAE